MKHLSMLALLLFASPALAEPSVADPPPAPTSRSAELSVKNALLGPLAAKEQKQSKFSRARMPPEERRVRLLDESPRTDARGEAFYTFAVDARHGINIAEEDWVRDTVTGCVYPERGEVFVKVGDELRPAALLLGKRAKPAAARTCVAADDQAT
jgi:hypothetical protein